MRLYDMSTGFSAASSPNTGTDLNIANNQGSPTDLTGLLFDSATYRGVVLEYDMRRKTDSSERRSIGVLQLIYTTGGSAWSIISDNSNDEVIHHGVTFSVTAGGQLQYTSDNQSGSNYSGSMRTSILRRY